MGIAMLGAVWLDAGVLGGERGFGTGFAWIPSGALWILPPVFGLLNAGATAAILTTTGVFSARAGRARRFALIVGSAVGAGIATGIVVLIAGIVAILLLPPGSLRGLG
jgi:hypothetical protein